MSDLMSNYPAHNCVFSRCVLMVWWLRYGVERLFIRFFVAMPFKWRVWVVVRVECLCAVRAQI